MFLKGWLTDEFSEQWRSVVWMLINQKVWRCQKNVLNNICTVNEGEETALRCSALRNDVGIRRQATKYDHLMIVHFLMSGYDKLHSSVPVERLVSVAGGWPHSVTCYFEWKQEKQWWKVTWDRMRTCLEPACCWERKRNRPRGLRIRLFACNKAWKEAREKTRNDWLWTFSGSSWKTKWGKEVYLFCERSLSFPAWLRTSFLLWYTTHRDEGDGIQRKKTWGVRNEWEQEEGTMKARQGLQNSQKRGTHENVSLSFFSLSSITQFELSPCLKNMNFYFRQDFLLPLLFSLFLHISFCPFLPLAAQAQWSKKWSTTYKRDSESIRLLTHFFCVIVNELGSVQVERVVEGVCFTSWKKYWQNSDRKNLWLMSRIVIYDVEK